MPKAENLRWEDVEKCIFTAIDGIQDNSYATQNIMLVAYSFGIVSM